MSLFLQACEEKQQCVNMAWGDVELRDPVCMLNCCPAESSLTSGSRGRLYYTYRMVFE